LTKGRIELVRRGDAMAKRVSPLAPIYECPNPDCRSNPLFVNDDPGQTCKECGAPTLRPLGDGSFTDRYGRVVKGSGKA
jgi:hypothetical protein